MNKDPDRAPESEAFTLNIDLRHVDTFHAISALRIYLDLMEQQMPIVQTCELATLEAERPPGNDEVEQSLYCNEINYLEQLFEEDLFPTMRYSFIVFLHTVFETRLRGFCFGIQRQHKLSVGLTDLRGSDIEQAKNYLTKLVDIKIAEFPEWKQLQHFQSIRNCIVHDYGYLSPKNSKHDSIRQFAATADGISITPDDRVILTRAFCEQHLTNIECFFKRLFEVADSKT